MAKTSRNIYQMARVMKGISQKSASSLLTIDEKTLWGYESGKYVPSSDMVVEMMKVYDAKWLGYLHLRESPIGQIVLPEIVLTKGFASSVITLHRTVNNLVKAMNDLMDIAENEVVDNSKEEAYQKICTEIEANVTACMTILVSEHKKRTAALPANGSR